MEIKYLWIPLAVILVSILFPFHEGSGVITNTPLPRDSGGYDSVLTRYYEDSSAIMHRIDSYNTDLRRSIDTIKIYYRWLEK